MIIGAENSRKYKELLINYYETNNKREISKFLKEECYIPLK